MIVIITITIILIVVVAAVVVVAAAVVVIVVVVVVVVIVVVVVVAATVVITIAAATITAVVVIQHVSVLFSISLFHLSCLSKQPPKFILYMCRFNSKGAENGSRSCNTEMRDSLPLSLLSSFKVGSCSRDLKVISSIQKQNSHIK